MVNPSFWRNKRVFLTGHTGFKGGWLAIWLHQLGAHVTGFALPPTTTPNLFETAGIDRLLTSIIGDIRDQSALADALREASPQIVLHLAAQPLVSEGYSDPVATYATNVMGTAHLLEAIRQVAGIEAVVVVTTDKCYENVESMHAYVESDRLGGYDPYASSKACAEILVDSWRRSFCAEPGTPAIATARAGNVIGGGDWAANRLIPDAIRALADQRPLVIRHPQAIRPWQHVLEPIAGYLMLAERLCHDRGAATAWNFGPERADCVTVEGLLTQLNDFLPTPVPWRGEPSLLPHEAGLLLLDASKAQRILKWRPRWRLPAALKNTADWYLAWLNGSTMQDFCRKQIQHYIDTAD